MANKIAFTNEDINKIIQLHNNGLLNKDIAKIYSVSKSTIARLLRSNNIPSKHPWLNQSRKNEICKLYLEGKNMKEICNILKTSESTIKTVLIENNILIKDMTDIKKKYQINDHYFDEIDDSHKAYYLGLLMADGSLSKPPKYKTQISLQEQDAYILQNMLDDMQSNHKLYFIDYKHKKESYQNQYMINISNKHLWEGLFSHGIVPNKSDLAKYPDKLPDDLFKYFLLGIIDGDGSVYIDSTSNTLRVMIVGTFSLLDSIKEKILQQIDINCYINNTGKSNNNTKYLRFTGTNAEKLMSWLYKDSDIYLYRKYNKFISFINSKCA